ncbi:MAG TPA: ATP-binding protein [Chitinophagaceae bacterium]|nr:ATP-binding protein [Chitinophagaceae bacterium]
MFAASSVALFALGFPDAGNTAHLSPVLKPETFPGFRQQRIGSYEVFIRDNRCHAVRYDRKGHTLYASFKEGLYTFSGQGYKQVTYQNVPVFSPALEYAGGKMFIATYAKGLLVKEGTQMKNITVNDGLLSNTIIRMKAIGNHLWLFLNVGIQVMDVTTLQIRSDLEFPNIAGINAFDVAEWNGSAYITTEEGIYKVPVNQRTVATVPDSYLNYVLINSTDTVTTQGVTLSHARNNIEFYLSAPWFDVTKKLHYQYRLRGNEVDEQWHNTDDLGSVIRYASLAPGDYVFESYAVDNNGNRERTGVRFAFTIRKPWWRQWWFLLSVVFVFLASTYALYRFRLYQLLRVERMRRSISSDLHDDIGSTLSSINIYTELAKRTEQNTEFLHLIQGNATDIITKLDDLVWGINPKNDTGEQLVSRMKLFAESLLSAAHIQFNLEYNPELTGMKLDLKQKQNIYLLFKEAVNNVAKHSGATRCTVRLKVSGRRLDMEITDNGRGFDPAGVNTNRNGLKNMRDRAAEMKGNASVYSEPGAGTRIHVQALL